MDMDMKLDYDILLMILTAVEHKATLISLMKTCRTLYANGIPALLCLPGSCDFTYNEHRLASFCKSMLVDDRCRYLTSLRIGSDFDSRPAPFAEDTVNLLTDVLEQAVNLRHLSLYWSEWLCETHPILATTISSLASIQNLALWQDGPRTAEMMKQIRSPIKDILLELSLSRENDDSISILSGLSATLEKLETWMYELKGTSTVFPRLHTLSVMVGAFVDITPFIVCFPNLHCLNFRLTEEFNLGLEVQQTRRSNRYRQSSVSWRSLRSLSGTPLSLYLLAVCCPVDHLHITNTTKWDEDTLLWILMDTLFITRLTITLPVDCLEWEDLPSQLSSLKKLTHLSVSLRLIRSPLAIPTVLYRLLGFIQSSSVTSLKIGLQPLFNTDLPNDQIRIGIEAYAAQMFGAVPTLRYVCSGIGLDFMPSWVYRRNDESPVPQLLSKKDGELVMEAEWDM